MAVVGDLRQWCAVFERAPDDERASVWSHGAGQWLFPIWAGWIERPRRRPAER